MFIPARRSKAVITPSMGALRVKAGLDLARGFQAADIVVRHSGET